jgi:hypothetical protein
MSSLPVRSPSRVVGLPSRWALDLAAGGVMLPFVSLMGPAMLTLGPPPMAIWANVLALAAATGLAGGLLGLICPFVLDKLRGQVPLALLAVLAATVSTAAMLGVTWLVTLPSAIALLWVLQGSVLGSLLWMPYLVATVLGRPTWPVVTAGLMSSTAVTLLFMLLF